MTFMVLSTDDLEHKISNLVLKNRFQMGQFPGSSRIFPWSGPRGNPCYQCWGVARPVRQTTSRSTSYIYVCTVLSTPTHDKYVDSTFTFENVQG